MPEVIEGNHSTRVSQSGIPAQANQSFHASSSILYPERTRFPFLSKTNRKTSTVHPNITLAVPGTALGAFAGTIRTTTPIFFALVSGAQWFAIGSTFYSIRTSLINQDGLLNWWHLTRGVPLIDRTDLTHTTSEKVKISSISGGLTGAILGLAFRGPRNVIPGTIMFTLFGFMGQHTYNFLDKRNTTEVQRLDVLKTEGRQDPNWLQRMAKSKYIPMSVLSDDEYAKMLGERLLGVEASIALVDERIEEWRVRQREIESEKKGEDKSEKSA